LRPNSATAAGNVRWLLQSPRNLYEDFNQKCADLHLSRGTFRLLQSGIFGVNMMAGYGSGLLHVKKHAKWAVP